MVGKLSRILGGVSLAAIWMASPAQVNAAGTPLHTLPEKIEMAPANQVKPSSVATIGVPHPGTNVNVSNLVGNESEVTIDINPLNPLNQVIVGHAPNFRTMNTFYTMDGGATWNLVALGNDQDGATSDFRFDPSVAFDDHGNVYVAYGARLDGTTPQRRTVVLVCRSIDSGQTYPQCNQLATNDNIGNLPGNDKWHLATGPAPGNPAQQNVYIAWTRNVLEGLNVDQQIVVSSSINGGATFSEPVIINDASIAGTSLGNVFADPAVGPNGELYVSWSSVYTGQIFLDRSSNGGVTFGLDTVVTGENIGFPGGDRFKIPPQPDRGIFSGPTIDTDRSGGTFDGRMYIAYTDRPSFGVDTDIFVRFSDDHGLTWSAPTRVNNDAGTNSQFLPWLDVDQVTGVVSVAWYDARNDVNNKKVQTFMAASLDGGVSFGPNILVSDGRSDQSVDNPERAVSNNFLEYIGIAIFNCRASVVWADNSTNLADLDFFTDQVQVPTCGAFTTVNIDIKPSSEQNSINTKSNGVISVAILSTAAFDATTVDPLSVTFGPYYFARELHGVGHIEDVNHDGSLDLLLDFGTRESGLAVGDIEACLSGLTFDGRPIHGCDEVRVLK